jgi:hypothetical protein
MDLGPESSCSFPPTIFIQETRGGDDPAPLLRACQTPRFEETYDA